MQIDFELLLNLPALAITHLDVRSDEIHIECHSRHGVAVCPSCLTSCSEVRKYYQRTLRDLPITGRVVYLHLTERQFFCPDCHHYFSERFPFVDPSRTMTCRYESYLYRQCQSQSISSVSVQENVIWDTVQDIYNRYAARQLAQEARHEQVRWLGIDEIALKKGHRDFVCVLVDLSQACVIDVLEQRDKSFISNYLQEKFGQKVLHQMEVFSCDMWDGYIALATELMPNASIVVDRFHLTKHIHIALDRCRKAIRKECPDDINFKNLRWALLKHPDALSPAENQLLENAFNAAPELEKVYLLKERFRAIFDAPVTRDEGEKLLKLWIEHAEALDNVYVKLFLKTLDTYKEYILNFFINRVSNGIVEGINNLIKFLKRQGFGYRNFEHFRYRVLINGT